MKKKINKPLNLFIFLNKKINLRQLDFELHFICSLVQGMFFPSFFQVNY